MQTSTKLGTMLKAFTVYKAGMTDKPVTILYDPSLPFDIDSKEAFYTSLGYTVTRVHKAL